MLISAAVEPTACAPASGATVAAPAVPNPLISPAPPYAPRPAIKPLPRSPLRAVSRPPTTAAAPIGVINGESAAPITIGRIFFRNPASANPVSGLIVNEPPCDLANACKPRTSLGAIWTRVVSGPRPLDARC